MSILLLNSQLPILLNLNMQGIHQATYDIDGIEDEIKMPLHALLCGFLIRR